MQNRKGRNRFFSLPDKTAVNVQVESLKTEFELAEKSVVGEAIATHYNEVTTDYEKKENVERISPGHMLIKYQGQECAFPLIDRSNLEELVQNRDYSN